MGVAFEVAFPKYMALCGFWGRLEVALGWLWTPESMPSIWLVYGFDLALGGLGWPDIRGSRSSKTRTFLARLFVRARESPRKLALPVETRKAGKGRITKTDV